MPANLTAKVSKYEARTTARKQTRRNNANIIVAPVEEDLGNDTALALAGSEG